MASPAIDQGTALMAMGALAGNSSFTATIAPLYARLVISAPTATVPGTQLPSGGGYTQPGLSVTLGNLTGTPSGCVIYNTTSLSWTNSTAAAWVLYGVELWDNSGAGTRKFFALIDGAPVTIGVGSPAPFAANAIAFSFP